MKYYLVRIRGTSGVDVFSSDTTYRIGEDVVVSSERGLNIGKIVRSMHSMETMGNIVHKATHEDIETYWSNLEVAKDMQNTTQAIITELSLGMDLMSVTYNLDRSKVYIEYLSEARIDFKELLKRLTRETSARIELRQMGARDRAKIVGGLGVCGREACCMHKRSFESITISMAKNQMLPINNDKLAGVCGKLKCCLAYENDAYIECTKGIPKLFSKVMYEDKEYRLSEINCMSASVLLTTRDERVSVSMKEFNLKGKKL
jgi:cell fate regulator YaaT (PSP1 superfamily)